MLYLFISNVTMILKYEFGFETALNLHAEGTGKRAPWKIASRRIASWKIAP